MTVADLLGCAAKEPMYEKDDFFATPEDVTLALIRAEGRWLPEKIWEPACGTGKMSDIISQSGRLVSSTDLVDRGYWAGQSGVDFLMEWKPIQPHVVTNPPWKLGHQFANHGLDIGIEYMALLVKSSFFNSLIGARLWGRWQPARIYSLNWRPDFTGGNAPPMTVDWVVWDGHPGFTQHFVLGRE